MKRYEVVGDDSLKARHSRPQARSFYRIICLSVAFAISGIALAPISRFDGIESRRCTRTFCYSRNLPAVDLGNPACLSSPNVSPPTRFSGHLASSLRVHNSLESSESSAGIECPACRFIAARGRFNTGHFKQTPGEHQRFFAEVSRRAGFALESRKNVECFQTRPYPEADRAGRPGSHDLDASDRSARPQR